MQSGIERRERGRHLRCRWKTECNDVEATTTGEHCRNVVVASPYAEPPADVLEAVRQDVCSGGDLDVRYLPDRRHVLLRCDLTAAGEPDPDARAHRSCAAAANWVARDGMVLP